MDYVPTVESLSTAEAKYLMSDDPWSAVISPVVNIASNPSATESILVELSKHRLIEVRIAVARNLNTPPVVLNTLFKDASLQVQAAVLWNPSAPQEYYEKFLNQTDLKHHELLADCWKTPPTILEGIHAKYKQLNPYGSDSAKSIFSRLASNPNTPQPVLKEIFKFTTTREILLALGNSPKILGEMTTAGRAGKLAEFKSKYGLSPNDTFVEQVVLSILTRQRFKDNPPYFNNRFPPELLIAADKPNTDNSYVLIKLTYAADPGIPSSVMDALLKEVKGKSEKKPGIDVLANPKLPKNELDQFCRSKDINILQRVALNPNITPECYKALTSDLIKNGKLSLPNAADWKPFYNQFQLLGNLLKNPAAPDELLLLVLYQPDRIQFENELFPDAIKGLLSRPNVPVQKVLPALLNAEDDILKRFSRYDDEPPGIYAPRGMGVLYEYKKSLDKRLERLAGEKARSLFLQELSKSESIVLRAYAAGNQLTLAPILELLSDDKTIFVKLELAKNENISEAMARKLMGVQEMIVFDKENTSFE